jgi:hypothetical protein
MDFKTFMESDQPEIKVIDTSTVTTDSQYLFGHSVICGAGCLIGYHVTDNAENVQTTLGGSKKITATYGAGRGRYAELGPGFYVSGYPEMWKNRSNKKWSFLDQLTPPEKQKLAQALMNEPVLVGKKYTGNDGQVQVFQYISKWEVESAQRDINNWLKTGNDAVIIGLSWQPYNIDFWKPEYLARLGIKPGGTPQVMKVVLQGRFADLSFNSHHHVTVVSKLIRSGLDGAFIKGGYIGHPQLVVWNKQAIKHTEMTDEF